MKTTNYNQFKILKSNRAISQTHVDALARSMQKYGFFNSKPITVTAKMEITDGQHRFYAAKQLGIPVLYEIDTIDSNESMIVLNSTSNIWRYPEYIHHYAKLGSPCYKDIEQFVSESGFGVSNCLVIYSNNSAKPAMIRNGAFIVKNPHFDRSVELIAFLKEKLGYNLHTQIVKGLVSFVADKTTESKHIERLKLNAFSIVQCATNEQYITQFNKLSKKK